MPCHAHEGGGGEGGRKKERKKETQSNQWVGAVPERWTVFLGGNFAL